LILNTNKVDKETGLSLVSFSFSVFPFIIVSPTLYNSNVNVGLVLSLTPQPVVCIALEFKCEWLV
jgi:hypothetical protein